MNNINLMGRLTKEIELKYHNDKHMANFSIAVQRTFKNKEGNYEADFINCSVFGTTADYLKTWTQKGSRIIVNGRLQTRNYQKESGEMQYITEVVVNNAEVIDYIEQPQNASTLNNNNNNNNQFNNFEEDDFPF
ncbi:MAG: single-stranded DNA-binding protein [Mycoplasmatales bacterium]